MRQRPHDDECLSVTTPAEKVFKNYNHYSNDSVISVNICTIFLTLACEESEHGNIVIV